MSKLTHAVITTMVLILASVPVASAQLTPGSSSLSGGDRPQPLPLTQAFPFYVSISNQQSITVSWQPAAGHYLYRKQFGFALKQTSESEALPVPYRLPDGLKKQDEFFGDIEAYYDEVTAILDLETDHLSGKTLVIQYQGCADWGFCYPPQTVEFPFDP